MNILVIGEGGREHALASAAYRSNGVNEVFVAPGSSGMQDVATLVDIQSDDIAGLVTFAEQKKIELTIVGPEAVLALGVVDAFEQRGLKIFGPNKAATRVESSKDFSKKIMGKYKIPTASYRTFTQESDAKVYVEEQGVPIVIKEDGLKAGKGVTVAATKEEAFEALQIAFEIPNNVVVIEECLVGFEYSLMSFVYHETVIPMEVAQDHKCAYNGDTGPNTGGMGAYSPVQKITPDIVEETMMNVMRPMAKAMVDEGVPFVGFLYGGLMLTDSGIKTIEFNARFGDPEAEVILPRLESDFIQTILDVMAQREVTLKWDKKVSLGVVLASTDYPMSSTNGVSIQGLDQLQSQVFHMGSAYQDGHYITNGGRVLCVVNKADTLEEAYANAYADVAKIKSNALFYRDDIGKKDMED